MIETTNKFAAILSARQKPDVEKTSVQVQTEPPDVTVSPVPTQRQKRMKPMTPAVTTNATEEISAPVVPVQGRGKRSDPNFRQITAYIPQRLHDNATIALRLANQTRLDAEKEDFSDLITRLLANWYEKQGFYKPNT